jgi:putative Mn2+ efflux pump MntP
VLHTLGEIAKLAALVLSLGADTFAVAVGLGLSGLDRRDRLRVGVSFALAEGLMPLAGFLAGRVVARVIGDVASYAAILLLLAVGLYVLWEATHEEERDLQPSSGWKLLATALSVSLDELAVGFSLGLLDIPILLAAVLIAVQAFVLTWIGTSLGGAIGERFAERAEVLSGAVLTLLALFLLGEKLVSG